MKLKDLTFEELELLSYTDLTYMLLKENKQSMNTPTIFKKICELLNLSDDYYAEEIGDYYTSLTIDKRFVLLDNKEWDIRDHHSIAISLDDDESDEEVFDIDEEEDEEENEDIDEIDPEFEENLDDDEIDEDEEEIGLEGLTIMPEEELEE
ncbi:MAG: DNA-directed RNA polymerase subunit delta [Bacilli bacterium]|nr:DNA-directed RNA polymerase subunit delta [Bacilli bacterium]